VEFINKKRSSNNIFVGGPFYSILFLAGYAAASIKRTIFCSTVTQQKTTTIRHTLKLMQKLNNLNFDNSYLKLPTIFFSKVKPTPVREPYLISFNDEVAKLVSLDHDAEMKDNKKQLVDFLSGNYIPTSTEPFAMLYSGHQFGSYNPQLGDGRAIMLGQVRNNEGQLWDLQLKGSGPTPYSRGFDGRAVLRSTIREYLASEAMHHLGIPTTRALSITGTDDEIERETTETGAMLVRVAPSHVRFGSFEIFYYRRQFENVKKLADYVIQEHFPQFQDSNDKYYDFYSTVVTRTMQLVAKWMAVGFEHGVMNTDNMSILGLTIDYGPYGFMDRFDPDWICNHSDRMGRYAYKNQPVIALWDLERLATALSCLDGMDDRMKLVSVLRAGMEEYMNHYYGIMSAKLGFNYQGEQDQTIIDEVLDIMVQGDVDYNNFFRGLSSVDHTSASSMQEFIDRVFHNQKEFRAWVDIYRTRLSQELDISDSVAVKALNEKMLAINPKFIPRNHILQGAILSAQNKDYSEVNKLLDLYRRPFDEHPGMEKYAKEAPKGYKVCISCSS
jgi:uncharacterized protein YdiU (UPF0061 family)